MLRLTLPAELDSLERVNGLVRCLVTEAALAERQGYRLRLAAEELFTNVIRHGFGGAARAGQVVVEGSLTDEFVRIRLVDTARPFDPFGPAGSTGPDRPLPAYDPPALGLHLARQAVDAASYVYADGTNQTTIMLSRVDRSDEPALTRWCPSCV